jgi:hypothetical protein
MVLLRIHQIVKAQHSSACALSKGTNLNCPRAGGVFGRLHGETLDVLCRSFHLQPGTLLQ